MSYPHFLEEAGHAENNANVVIIPVPLANTVSWQKGTENGPDEILRASDALELFDDELFIETYKIGISTIEPLAIEGLSNEEACSLIFQTVSSFYKAGIMPVVIGGEHTVSFPAVNALAEVHPDLHVVQIDAHLDLRHSYLGDSLSHACVMRRIDELGIPFSQVGIRSFSKKEWEFIEKKGYKPFTMQRISHEADWLNELCEQISGPVYLTIDVDGFDSSIMPATGTPEPGGLSWAQMMEIAGAIAKKHSIVGFDCVEFSPIPGGHHAAYTVAKLIYRILGFIYKNQLN